MADKLRAVAPLDITFRAGEQPSAEKLTAIARQSRTGITMLEKAVGDLWNQSGDPIMSNFPLQISNLARHIGEGRYLNPAIFPTIGDFVYEDNVGSKFTGESKIYLQFKPKASTSFTWNAQYTTEQSDPQLVTTASGYYVDDNTGRAVLGSDLVSTTYVTYTVDPTDWNVGTETLPGIIPDPRQSDFIGCRISESGGTYYLHFPPRLPISFISSWDRPERYPDTADYYAVNDNYDSTVQTNKRLWQDPTVSALNHAHYRYALPKELQDEWGSIAVGDALPTGFIYVWDRAADQVVADAVLKKTSDSWVFEIESTTLDLDSYVTSDESESSYNSTQLSVVTAGAPLARSLWTIMNSLYNHRHGNEGDFSPLMEHSRLLFLNPPGENYADHYGSYPVSGVEWGDSNYVGDDHLYLLSRTGSHGPDTTATGEYWRRDPLDNAMLGDFVLADQTRTLDADCGTGSFKVCFGAKDGPSIQGFEQTIRFHDFIATTRCSATMTDGDNDDVTCSTSFIELVGSPSTTFNLTGITNPGQDGVIIMVLNNTGQTCHFPLLDGGSTAGNRIYSAATSVDLGNQSVGMLFYDTDLDSGNGAWRVLRTMSEV